MSKCLLLFLIALASGAKAQDYNALAVEGSRWFYEEYEAYADIPQITNGYMISIAGDSLINGKVYHQVFLHQMAGAHNCQFPPCWTFELPYRILSSKLVSLIYEDESKGHVYNMPVDTTVLDFCSTEEYLLFDFSLQQGDSLNECALEVIKDPWEESKVGIVDTVFIADASFDNPMSQYFDFPTRVYSVWGSDYFAGLLVEHDVYILEGVGYRNLGVFGRKGASLTNYCRGSLEDCNIVSTAKTISDTWVNIVPNPVKSILSVDSNASIDKILILDAEGRKVAVRRGAEAIEVSGLAAGLYHAFIFLDDNKYLIKRFVKL